MSFFPDSESRHSSAFGRAYTIRVQLGLVAALAIVLLLVRLPLQSAAPASGWLSSTAADRIVLQRIQPDKNEEDPTEQQKRTAPPATKILPPDPAAPSPSDPSPESTTDPDEKADNTASDSLRSVRSLAALSPEDARPEILGGTRALYLHIQYPREARLEGVEGRLKIAFTVDKRGNARRVDVVESLHPLCDSAATDAIKSVKFSPARVEGEPIPVRMELPIRFQLRSDSSGADDYRTAAQDS